MNCLDGLLIEVDNVMNYELITHSQKAIVGQSHCQAVTVH